MIVTAANTGTSKAIHAMMARATTGMTAVPGAVMGATVALPGVVAGVLAVEVLAEVVPVALAQAEGGAVAAAAAGGRVVVAPAVVAQGDGASLARDSRP